MTRTRRLLAAALGVLLATSLGAVPGGAVSSDASQAPPGPSPEAEQAPPFGDAPGGKTVVGETSPVHDPALVVEGDTWYVFSTGLVNRENGGTIQIWSSADQGTTWAYEGTVWDQIPAWIDEHFSDGALPDNLWAPEVYEHDGTYYLYYSASRFGQNTSLTALATNTTLDPDDPDYEWVDQGMVVSSPVTGLDPENPDKTFNAIDPGIVEDGSGQPWMAIGSHWYGIFLVPLEWPSGKPAPDWRERTVNIADRFMPGNPVEGAYIEHRDGWYYLFVSFDRCCAGADSTYKVAVGRSREVTGPYLDQDGRDMFGGGGTVILEEHGAVVGPGGQSVHGDYLAFHYYDAANEDIPYFPTLGLQKLDWVDGWPVTDMTVEPVEVTAAPRDRTVSPRQPARFTVRAAGTPEPVAVWHVSRDGGGSWARVPEQPRTLPAPGADEVVSTLVLEKPSAEDDGLLVRAVVQHAHGTTTTEPARLTVRAVG